MKEQYLSNLYLAGKNCFSYLLSSIKEDGTFIYELNPNTGKRSNKYNILRHAGTLYALYQWIDFSEDTKAYPLLNKPTEYLLKQIKPVMGKVENIVCTIEEGEVKLGGSALSLLMLIERYKIQKDIYELETMKNLARFIVWMQEPTGRFKSKFLFEKGEFSNFVSIYYSGQAILALVRLYKIDSNPIWLNAAELGSKYLLKNPVMKSNNERGHNHWLTIALSELCIYKANEDFYNELYLILKPTIASVYRNLKYLDNEQNHSKLYSSAAMATRGEAIMAAAVLEAYVENYSNAAGLLVVVEKVLSYCLSLQISDQTSLYSTGIMGGIKKTKLDSSIRIDYVQHVLHVIIGFLSVQKLIKKAEFV